MPLRFVKIAADGPVVTYLADNLSAHLARGERVFWLVTGGSAVPLAASVARKLRDQKQPLDGLVVTLTDERYGEPGHPDSIWQQLAAAGFVLPGATLLPVLIGADFDATAAAFGRLLDARLAGADFSLGLFGIGPDGHTAGILPHSPAVAATEPAVAYHSAAIPGVRPPFPRITMTAPAIARLTEAVVYAVGKAKWPTLDDLAHDVPLADQPAQALKSVQTLTIFNDHTGEQA
jgi:6-phosphogluconolactonase/glucosamine-6-phosphate isomerase/deaminase